mmetsp:Transcript_84905/g.236913  ORF Transcript_84905/g.236913 Transcript_84905/m.236913 type:complete len:100 (+) Transcript_84905:90-389(+)
MAMKTTWGGAWVANEAQDLATRTHKKRNRPRRRLAGSASEKGYTMHTEGSKQWGGAECRKKGIRDSPGAPQCCGTACPSCKAQRVKTPAHSRGRATHRH